MREDNPKLLNETGEKYFAGIGVEKNLEIAYQYFKKASDLDNPVGYYNLSRYFTVKSNYKEAFAQLQKAMSYGYVDAAIDMVELYLHGKGVHKSKKKAFKVLLDFSKTNEPKALNRLGEMYEDGNGVKKDEAKALETYQKSADAKDLQGMYLYSSLLLKGKYNPKTFETALHYLDQASVKLHQDSLLKIKSLYDSNHPYFSKKSLQYLKEMSFYYEEHLAKAGNSEALSVVAKQYYTGSDLTKPNPEKAYQYYEELAKLSHPEGYYGVGLCLMNGVGCKQDFSKARELLQLSASLKHAGALTKLGDLERSVAKTQSDFEKAKTYYFEAAKQNDTEALMNLSLLHYRNQIQGASADLAFQTMSQASSKGNVQAYYWLGVYHEKGIGTKPSGPMAEKMFAKAIEHGHKGALFKYGMYLFENAKKEVKPKKKTIASAHQGLLFLSKYLSDATPSQNQLVAMMTLSKAFEEGFGVKKQPKAARYWIEKAAQSKDSNALVELYRMVKDDFGKQAVEYLKTALADTENARAYHEMGELYFHGDLVEKDLEKAKRYYEVAAKKKYQPSIDRLLLM